MMRTPSRVREMFMNVVYRRLLIVLVIVSVNAVSAYHNETIDDPAVDLPSWGRFVDPTWQTIHVGALLTGTTISSSAYVNQPINFTFSGTAIYFQSILWIAGGNFSATVDGVQSGGIVNTFIPSASSVRSTIVWSAQNLPNGPHNVIITLQPNTTDWAPVNPKDGRSYLYLDAFIVTHPDATDLQSASSSPNAGAIAGGVIGGIVFILLVVAAFFFYRRRQNQQRKISEKTNDSEEGPMDIRSPLDATPFVYTAPPTSNLSSTSVNPILGSAVGAAAVGAHGFPADVKRRGHTVADSISTRSVTDTAAPSSSFFPPDVKIRPLPTLPGSSNPTSPTGSSIPAFSLGRSPSDLSSSVSQSTRYTPSATASGSGGGSGRLERDVEDLRAQVEALRAVALASPPEGAAAAQPPPYTYQGGND